MYKKVLTALFFMLVTANVFAGEILTKDQALNVAQNITDGRLVKIDFDSYKSALVYEVEILDSSNYMHKIKVDAISGEVVKQSKETMSATKSAVLSSAKITHAQAADAALAKLSDSIVISSELESKGGKAVYDISLVDPKGLEHEAVIDAVTADVISIRQDEIIVNMPKVNINNAESAAKKSVAGKVLYSKVGQDDGKVYYKVYVLSNDDRIFEVKIDGNSGKVLKSKVQD